MKRFIEYEVATGVIKGSFSTEGAAPIPKAGLAFVDVTSRQDALVSGFYNAATDEFSSESPATNTILSHADVLGLLTPQEWAEMNRYGPMQGSPYDNAEIYYAVSLFNQSRYVDISDARVASMLGVFVFEGLITPQRAAELQAQMVALAASKGPQDG